MNNDNSRETWEEGDGREEERNEGIKKERKEEYESLPSHPRRDLRVGVVELASHSMWRLM